MYIHVHNDICTCVYEIAETKRSVALVHLDAADQVK